LPPAEQHSHGWLHACVRVVALVELSKGALVLVVGLGLLTFLHKDVQTVAEQLVHHLHLDPASHFPHVFIDLAGRITSRDLWLLSTGAAVYAAVRLAEGYGLWHERAWAEWLGAISGLIYVPFEIAALTRSVTPLKITTLVINIVVVAVLVDALLQRQREREAARRAASGS
jgi:uncharacterized membrane protein (DUF2068 family)